MKKKTAQEGGGTGGNSITLDPHFPSPVFIFSRPNYPFSLSLLFPRKHTFRVRNRGVERRIYYLWLFPGFPSPVFPINSFLDPRALNLSTQGEGEGKKELLRGVSRGRFDVCA